MLPSIYILALGLIVAAFVEIGIYTFVSSPEWDDEGWNPNSATEEETKARNDRWDAFHKLQQRIREKISVLSLILSIVLLAVSLALPKDVNILADGILLGGVFTLLFGVGLGIQTGGRIYRFIVATVSLIVALALGYLKFVRK